ncbi:MAG: HEPN domain-containing protein [Candidatus Aenigmarchaeota archaeon]|nr:HEPN domain-containing protein [Candidatus Aenigmarchaeota archaeon]
MTMARIPDSARKHWAKAGQFLSDAEAASREKRLATAVDRTYYAMFHAATALLITHGFRPPKTHRGLLHLFLQNIVRAGILPADCGKAFQRAQEVRQEGTYAVDAEFTAPEVQRLITKRETLSRRCRPPPRAPEPHVSPSAYRYCT